jgi:hypothetical protein
LGLFGCEKTGTTGFNIPMPKDLKPGGVYVAYNHGCQQGCDQVEKGDLIQKIDGKAVSTGHDFDAVNVTDGKPHKLDILDEESNAAQQVTIVAEPQSLPPIEKAPPFWTVGAEALNRAPDFARRRMFGHASPMLMLVNSNGGILDGRQLYGAKRFIVYWDWGTRNEQGQAITFMKVLQKAQEDLKTRGVEIMFVHVQFPQGRQAPMNDSDLRAFQQEWTEKKPDGTAYEPLPLYRWPNATEFNSARQLGMENAFTVFENLGSSPTLVLMDERGIIRWHSEGVQTPLEGEEIKDPAQYTIIEAIKFALEKL